jgi:membrane protein
VDADHRQYRSAGVAHRPLSVVAVLAYLRVPLPWREILKRTFDEAFFKDNCLGMAAQLAYYFFFALFPAMLVLLALTSSLTADPGFVDKLFATFGGIIPTEGLRIATEQLVEIRKRQGGLLTLGVFTALWSSSAAMTAIIDTLNNAYDIQEGRPWWKVRIIAILLTIGVAIFIVVSFTLVLAGPTIADTLSVRLGLGPVFAWSWKVLQWPLVFALVSIGFGLIYYFAPDAEQEWVWLTPGSVLATTLWLLASLGLKYYVGSFASYETYGVVGGVMVLLLWFYVSGLVILIGAELNAEIEHASPYGKDPGEKVPGQRRRIGPAAMRAWLRRRRETGRPAPSMQDVKAVVEAGRSTAGGAGEAPDGGASRLP